MTDSGNVSSVIIIYSNDFSHEEIMYLNLGQSSNINNFILNLSISLLSGIGNSFVKSYILFP